MIKFNVVFGQNDEDEQIVVIRDVDYDDDEGFNEVTGDNATLNFDDVENGMLIVAKNKKNVYRRYCCCCSRGSSSIYFRFSSR